jgi:hypothetical protein
MKGDLVEMENGEIVIVRRFESDGRIWISAVNAAGTDKMLNETNSLHRIGLSDFLKKRPKDSDSPQPIRIDPIGNKSRIELGA